MATGLVCCLEKSCNGAKALNWSVDSYCIYYRSINSYCLFRPTLILTAHLHFPRFTLIPETTIRRVGVADRVPTSARWRILGYLMVMRYGY